MKSIHIRDVPELVLERLKRRAQLHRRSLQGELHQVLADAARSPLPDDAEGLTLKTVRTQGTKNWSRDAIYED
jgi:plasmid stability protein